jgi:hypothetical protein
VSRLPFWLRVGVYYLMSYVLTGILVHSVVNLMVSFCLLGMAIDLRANILNSVVYTLWAAVLIRYGKRYYARSHEITSLSSF